MPFQDRTDGSVFYLGHDTEPLRELPAPRAQRPKDPIHFELLWGDRVRRLRDDQTGDFIEQSGRWKVKARGREGWIEPAALGGRSLLEFYFIDVGQGDGVLIKTPDNRHILVDGGWPRKKQPTGKNASDFVDWKFMKDYETELGAIELDAIVCSHNDQDHYGGLWDLLDSTQWRDGDDVELDAGAVLVEDIYHAGVSWWRPGDKTLGPVVEREIDTDGDGTPETTKFLTQLLGDRASVEHGIRTDIPADERLQGEWADFLRECAAAKTGDGTPTPIHRLSATDGHLPGFGPSQAAAPAGAVDEPVVFVLAPVEFEVDGAPALRRFGGSSKNTNGNSILMRVDLGDFRVLLTGDLNTKSQGALLRDYRDTEDVFECDVAKACHHGSDDVSFSFLERMKPQVTIISSGDSEGHDHPAPEVIAASAITGWKTVENDKLKTPLIYCTELARSVEVGLIVGVDDLDEAVQPPTETPLEHERLRATAKVTFAGDLHPRTVRRRLRNRYLVTGTVYGLVNVRTDGTRLLCAALNEKDRTWNVTEIEAKVGAD